jgi:hypothetical protein
MTIGFLTWQTTSSRIDICCTAPGIRSAAGHLLCKCTALCERLHVNAPIAPIGNRYVTDTDFIPPNNPYSESLQKIDAQPYRHTILHYPPLQPVALTSARRTPSEICLKIYKSTTDETSGHSTVDDVVHLQQQVSEELSARRAVSLQPAELNADAAVLLLPNLPPQLQPQTHQT